MGEFFKPWRRKMGVLTLVMAVLSATVWVRSLSIQDVFRVSLKRPYMLSSMNGSLSWFIDYDGSPLAGAWSIGPAGNFDNRFNGLGLNWNWKVCGFAEGTFLAPFPNFQKVTFFMIPYWSIVFPLTLLSAWFLLNKPRSPSAAHQPSSPNQL